MVQFLHQLLQQHQRLAECLLLFWAPFLHEDVAIVTAAAFIHACKLTIELAFGCLYAGVVASDLLIYSLGRGARSVPKLRRFIDSKKLQQAQTKLKKNRVYAIMFCRLVPGLLFPTFAACGWCGLSFLQFFIPAMITSLVYTGILLVLVLKFGEAIVHMVGMGNKWGWLIIVGLVILITCYSSLRKLITLHTRRNRLAAGLPEEPDTGDCVVEPEDLPAETVFNGMPPLSELSQRLGISERIPMQLFYIPLGLWWIGLSIKYRSLTLPGLANPHIEAGGLWGESKSKCLGQIGPDQQQWVAKFITLVRGPEARTLDVAMQQADEAIAAAGFSFPLVAKPDVGWQGFGVRLVHNTEELREYLASYPDDATIILQEFIPYDGEAGVFYARMPGEDTGQVISLTFRYFPHVIGDGESTVRELIERDPRTCFKSQFYTGGDRAHCGIGNLDRVPAAGAVVRLSFIGSIRVGGLYRDGRKYITPALTQRFDAIARSMPDFHYGRFDIRFKSVDRLQEGEDFSIIEINGAGAEAIHMWDPEMSLRDAYHELIRFHQLLFKIGDKNRERGFKPMSLREFYMFTAKQNRLISKYPPSV